MTIRLATWNLWAFDVDRTARLEQAIGVLGAAAPDVCCLQEAHGGSAPADRPGGREDATFDAVGTLADSLGMNAAFGGEPSPWWRKRLGDPAALVGNAVLSRWPIREQVVEPLPVGDGTDEARHVLGVHLDTPDGPVFVATTQLTSSPLDSPLRLDQVRHLAAFCNAQRRDDELVVVAGDLNAEPDSDEVRLLCGHKTGQAAPGFVLMDTWRFAPHGDPGWTWDRRNPYVRSTNEPDARIDYLLTGVQPSGRLPAVSSVELLAPSDPQRPASDHHGIIVALQLDQAGRSSSAAAESSPLTNRDDSSVP